MAEVLVLVDHVDGEIKKNTYEMLTAARRLGEPSAVVVGTPGTATKLAEGLAAHGAAKVYVAESDDAARYWFSSVQQRYLDRLRCGGAPMRHPDDVELDWSAGERYRVDAMLDAALVGCAETVRAGLAAVHRRVAPDEVMAMTDLPDPEATMRSFARLAEVLAATPATAAGGRA